MPQSVTFRPEQMGVYIHWPFCAAKCPYCDFNSHVANRINHARWKDSYLEALGHYAEKLPDKQVVSVFFGGGTPSLMEPETVDAIISEIQRLWPVANDLEITLEANPTSVEAKKFEAFRMAGVNRVSLGVQALNDNDLKFLGREHSASEALKAIEVAGRYFDRYSFDLIYARPGQTLKAWEKELTQALEYPRGHLSLYQLTIERSTPFYMRHKRGEFQIPDDVQGAEFYHLTQDIMEEYGLPAYEVSNHSTPGQACRHNLVYWHYADYIGIGPGAHGRFMQGGRKYASRDHSAPEVWLERVGKSGAGSHPLEELSPEDCFIESLMMGLRLVSGVNLFDLSQKSGKNFNEMIDQESLDKAIEENWAIYEDGIFRLTREGHLRLNALLPYLLTV